MANGWEAATGGACNFIKKDTLAQVFSCEFCEIFKNTFLHRTPLMVASDYFYVLTTISLQKVLSHSIGDDTVPTKTK